MHEASPEHVPVMAEACLECLAVRPDGRYVDCTVGLGGHAALIAARLETGALLGLDRDPQAVARARERLAPWPQVEVAHANYADLPRVLEECGWPHVDGILIDAGVSSMQLDTPERGFSFQQEAALDMRMDTSKGLSAAEWLAGVGEESLAHVLWQYGDLRQSRRIAAAIIRRRDAGALHTTSDLRQAVHEALPHVRQMPEEVRTVFQAVRMAVNEELQHLEAGVKAAVDALAPGGRLAVLTFHSGEDRVVKNILRDASRKTRELQPDGRVRSVTPPRLKLLSSRPMEPGPAEKQANPRSKSARLRAAQKLSEGAAS